MTFEHEYKHHKTRRVEGVHRPLGWVVLVAIELVMRSILRCQTTRHEREGLDDKTQNKIRARIRSAEIALRCTDDMMAVRIDRNTLGAPLSSKMSGMYLHGHSRVESSMTCDCSTYADRSRLTCCTDTYA